RRRLDDLAGRRPGRAVPRHRAHGAVSDRLALEIRRHAYLEGDFVLRSGKRSSYYLDKYRFETRPDLLRLLGERIAAEVAEHAPAAARLAGPELGALAPAAAGAAAPGPPVPPLAQAA